MRKGNNRAGQMFRLAEPRRQTRGVDDAGPAPFVPGVSPTVGARLPRPYWTPDEASRDFLGNEYLLWLWYVLDAESDALALGVGAPLRESGDVKDSPGILVEGPRGCVRLDHGVIRTLHHIHLATDEAAHHGLKDRDRIDVAEEGAHPHTLFCDVLVRVSSGCKTELHLDPDESDAAGLRTGAYVAIKRKP